MNGCYFMSVQLALLVLHDSSMFDHNIIRVFFYFKSVDMGCLYIVHSIT